MTMIITQFLNKLVQKNLVANYELNMGIGYWWKQFNNFVLN